MKTTARRILSFWFNGREQWQHYVSRFYLGAYLEKMGLESNLSHQDEVLIRTYLTGEGNL